MVRLRRTRILNGCCSICDLGSHESEEQKHEGPTELSQHGDQLVPHAIRDEG